MPEESEEGLEVELCPCGVPWCPVSAVRRTAGTAAAEGRRCVVVPDRHGPRLALQARPVRFVTPWPENLEDAVKRLADLRAFGVPRFHGPAWSEVDATELAGSHWGREGGVTWKRLGSADMDERLTFSCIASHEMCAFVTLQQTNNQELEGGCGEAFTHRARGGCRCWTCALNAEGTNKTSWSQCRIMAQHLEPSLEEQVLQLGDDLLQDWMKKKKKKKQKKTGPGFRLLWWLQDYKPPGATAKENDTYDLLWFHNPDDHAFLMSGTVEPLGPRVSDLREDAPELFAVRVGGHAGHDGD